MRVPGTRRLFYGRLAGLALAGLVLAGCASKPVVTPVALTVRVYALKSPGPFESADFFSLFEKDQATLGAEMVQREEMLLRPGDSKKLSMTLPADAKAIAILAAYRDLERARWREVRAVEPGKPVALTVTFGSRQIRVEAAK